jgi:hypothetical protein
MNRSGVRRLAPSDNARTSVTAMVSRNKRRSTDHFGQLVLVLYHVCPDGQLFPQRPRANLGQIPKYEPAITIAPFAPAPRAAAHCSATTPRRSRVAGHGLRPPAPTSRITNHPSPPTNHALPNRYPIIRNPSNLLTTNEKTFSNRYFFELFGAGSTPSRSPITNRHPQITSHQSPLTV